ncbi:TetR family transcriptional regulator [Jiangella muralis]|uniref:TetR family transcriptional regulator n=1 Tax=Jiangella muralis TaxID=702383 RepID=UPI00069D6B7A|nr:TetR/AcrR family transcriptional regulator C-terminal domain-containing protein [Jiangella muralis]
MANRSRPTRAKKKGAAERPPITVDQILDAALEIVDTEGIDALGMRRVAGDLGVYPQTLYWHLGNKAQLVALLFQRVLDGADIPSPEGHEWDRWLKATAIEVRRALGEHPHLAPVFASTMQVSSPSLRLAELTLRALSAAGFSGHQLLTVYNAYMGSVFGWISTEFSAQPLDADDAWQDEFREHLRSVGDEAPTISGNYDLLANKAFMLRWGSGVTNEMTDSFDLMVESLLKGFASMREG